MSQTKTVTVPIADFNMKGWEDKVSNSTGNALAQKLEGRRFQPAPHLAQAPSAPAGMDSLYVEMVLLFAVQTRNTQRLPCSQEMLRL